jgi:DNA invertase Pin-like site-specific DNA recombinase
VNQSHGYLHLFAALAEQERRVISERMRLALPAAKARDVLLGGTNRQSLANQEAARQRAEQLRSIFAELAELSARAEAIELNSRTLRRHK